MKKIGKARLQLHRETVRTLNPDALAAAAGGAGGSRVVIVNTSTDSNCTDNCPTWGSCPTMFGCPSVGYQC